MNSRTMYITLLLTLFIFSCKKNQKQEYVCTPCNLACDTLQFSNAVSCPHCNMSLIRQDFLNRMNQTVYSGKLKINYEFLDEESLEKEPEFTEVISRSFTVYEAVFGGLPWDLMDIPYTEFTIKVSKTKDQGGEVDSKHITFNWSKKSALGYGSWKTTLMHELFHLWNGATLGYKNGEENWFNEGFTEFYTFQTATKLGIISPEEMLSTSALVFGYYTGSSGLGNISMREAAKDDKAKFENFFLVYHGGWTVALILDVDIRTKTNGQKSLDDLMKWLYHNFYRTEKLYQTDDIIHGLLVSTGLDYTTFFNDYVYQTGTIPVANYFNPGEALWDYKWDKSERFKHDCFYFSLGLITK